MRTRQLNAMDDIVSRFSFEDLIALGREMHNELVI